MNKKLIIMCSTFFLILAFLFIGCILSSSKSSQPIGYGQNYTLTISYNRGAIGENIILDPPPTDGKYSPGTLVKITVKPRELFDGWIGDNATLIKGQGSESDPYYIKMDSNMSITANYKGPFYQLNYQGEYYDSDNTFMAIIIAYLPSESFLNQIIPGSYFLSTNPPIQVTFMSWCMAAALSHWTIKNTDNNTEVSSSDPYPLINMDSNKIVIANYNNG